MKCEECKFFDKNVEHCKHPFNPKLDVAPESETCKAQKDKSGNWMSVDEVQVEYSLVPGVNDPKKNDEEMTCGECRFYKKTDEKYTTLVSKDDPDYGADMSCDHPWNPVFNADPKSTVCAVDHIPVKDLQDKDKFEL